MRYFFYIIFLVIVVFFASKIITLLFRGKLFEEGALKKEFKEGGKTLWLGMRLFVILWFIYLLVLHFVQKQ